MSNELDFIHFPEEVNSVSIKEQKVFDGVTLPFILSPADSFKSKDSQYWNDWVRNHLKFIEGILLKHGAILFRGFPFDAPTDFDEFAKAYDYQPFRNEFSLGSSANVVGNVHTSNDLPPGGKIPFHHEMSYIKDYPLILFLYCDVPAKEGGETPLVLSNVIYQKMGEREPEFVSRLERDGLRYMRVAPDGSDFSTPYGRGWQAMFAPSREEAERKIEDFGFSFKWLDDGSVKTWTEVLPAIRLDRRTGKKIWFNSVLPYAIIHEFDGSYDKAGAFCPNGDTIKQSTIETLKEVFDEFKVSFKWQRKDVIMIDNRSVLHARSDFFVPPRRILVSLYSDYQGPI